MRQIERDYSRAIRVSDCRCSVLEALLLIMTSATCVQWLRVVLGAALVGIEFRLGGGGGGAR